MYRSIPRRVRQYEASQRAVAVQPNAGLDMILSLGGRVLVNALSDTIGSSLVQSAATAHDEERSSVDGGASWLVSLETASRLLEGYSGENSKSVASENQRFLKSVCAYESGNLETIDGTLQLPTSEDREDLKLVNEIIASLKISDFKKANSEVSNFAKVSPLPSEVSVPLQNWLSKFVKGTQLLKALCEAAPETTVVHTKTKMETPQQSEETASTVAETASAEAKTASTVAETASTAAETASTAAETASAAACDQKVETPAEVQVVEWKAKVMDTHLSLLSKFGARLREGLVTAETFCSYLFRTRECVPVEMEKARNAIRDCAIVEKYTQAEIDFILSAFDSVVTKIQTTQWSAPSIKHGINQPFISAALTDFVEHKDKLNGISHPSKVDDDDLDW